MKLRTDLIRTDGGTQMRVGPYNEDVLKDYGEVVTGGGQLPPLTVFQEGNTYWLADGFHRLKAYKNLNVKEVEADVREGGKRDAILYAVGANASHGLRRTSKDKRQAIETLLRDDEWVQWSDSEIARRCGVSHPTVAKLRGELTEAGILKNLQDAPRRVERNGTTYEQRQPVRAQAAPIPERQPVVDIAEEPAPPPDTEFGPIIDAPPVARPLPALPQLPDGYRPGADPNIPPRLDALRKALDVLLRFDKDGKDLLDHRGSDLMQLKLLAYYAHKMLASWLGGTAAADLEQEVKTIAVEALN